MADIRVWGYSGIVQIEKRLQKQFSSDSVQMRQEPYLWSQKITLNGGTAVETVVQANDQATIVFVEVPDGTAVRYEVNPGGPGVGSHRDASTLSPRLTGEAPFQWFKGATMSFVDAASV